MRPFVLLLALCVGASGCLVQFRRPDVDAVAVRDLPSTPRRAARFGPTPVVTPLRVHLDDGSVVLFPRGAVVGADSLVGADGQQVTFPDGATRPVRAVAMDRVLGVEAYSTDIDVVPTLLATAGASVLTVYGVAGLGVILFGSCPTVYATTTATTTADTLALEAELFSNSIAPLFEMRDRDVLRFARPGADGLVRLEVRNEALETHYVNHLALEAVAHAPDARAVPSDDGRALVLADEAPPTAARDRAGRDVRAPLAAVDGVAYATADEVTAAVAEGDLWDTVTLTFPRPDVPPGSGGEAALALRFRSSLLTTVLLYEHMLAGQGPQALDWLGEDMASIGTVAAFGDFYVQRFGLRVEVEDGDAFREVARVAEAGPVAWAERAVVVPLPDTPTVRIRLRFLADGWRIDRATLAGRVERVPTVAVPLVAATDDAGNRLAEVEAGLGRTDQAYAVQGPGRAYHATFAPPPVAPGQAQTLFVSAQGHYSEWMRPDWLRRPASRFEPTDSTLVAAVGTWRRLRETYEAGFWSSRLPVR